MALFFYDSATHAALREDLDTVRVHCKALTKYGSDLVGLKSAVRCLTNHDLLVVPRSMEHHTPVVERLMAIAHLMGVQVQNLGVYASTNKHALRKMAQPKYANNPAVSSAVPANPALAAAGQPSTNF